jgi:23S rRNA pseudouridine1911/1915/1917 synthase
MRRLKVLYCDNHLLFVHKPAGVLAQSDGTDRLDLVSMAKQHVVDRFRKPGAAWLAHGLLPRLRGRAGDASGSWYCRVTV